MELFFTRCFQKDYKKLPTEIQKRASKKLEFLLQNISHLSLRIKKVKKYKSLFESSVTMRYRCLFRIDGDFYYLIRIGRHDEMLK